MRPQYIFFCFDWCLIIVFFGRITRGWWCFFALCFFGSGFLFSIRIFFHFCFGTYFFQITPSMFFRSYFCSRITRGWWSIFGPILLGDAFFFSIRIFFHFSFGVWFFTIIPWIFLFSALFFQFFCHFLTGCLFFFDFFIFVRSPCEFFFVIFFRFFFHFFMIFRIF